MKRLFCVLCLPALLFGLLSSCTPEYSKEAFLPAQAAFEAVADYVRVLYDEADAEDVLQTAEGKRMLLTFYSDGKVLFNLISGERLKTTLDLQRALQTVRTFHITELSAEETGLYFWVEGYNNGMVYTANPAITRRRVKQKFRHRIYRLAKHWYCIGEHYI